MCGHIEAAKEAMKACKGLDKSQTEVGLFPDSHANDAAVVKQMTRPDNSSFANFDIVKVLNYHLDLVTDFETSTMSGSVTFNLQTVVANAGVAVFDIRDIDVKSAHIVTGSKDVAGVLSATEWWITRREAKLGQALVVRLPAGLPANTTVDIKVEYKTSPSASAVQWLTAEQTVGKQYPYIFTQCQAIHARSLLPCMDSPGTKSTYTAALTVPAPLQALMSAILVDEKPVTVDVNGKPHNQWKFDQRIPIPIYLIAILVGNLQKRDLSHRCGVWSEPEVVDKAAWEFADLEKIVAAGESICGPYEWGRYDIAVLPGSFPYGGMESQMTFLTPSLITGSKDLVNVVIHELTHSYSGNSVTNNDWQSFFLNEGFTVFIERKILEIFEGTDVKGLHTMIGWEDLKQSIADFSSPDKIKYTSLFIDMSDDADPDDAFSSVPYEKGCAMLTYLEKLVGGPAVMNPFLKAYFAHFKFQSISAQQFQDFFVQYMLSQGVDKAALDSIDWVTWLTGYGLPPKPEFSDVLAREAYALSSALVGDGALPEPETVKMAEWSSAQRTVFLDRLIELQEEAINAADDKQQVQQLWSSILDNVAKYFDYTKTQNAELVFRWLTLQVRGGVAGIEDKVAGLLTTYGRMKFTRPLYRDMFKSEKFREFGQKLFVDNKSFYHNICVAMVEKDREEALQNAYVW